MKKIIALVLAAMMMLAATAAIAETTEAPEPKLGQVVTYIHGHGFGVATAVVEGETIILAKIDEFQFLGDREDIAAVGVPVNVKSAEPLDPKVLSELSVVKAPVPVYQYIFASKRKKYAAKTYLKKKGMSMH